MKIKNSKLKYPFYFLGKIMQKIFFTGLVIISMIFISCKNGGEDTKPSGFYFYKSYDTTGTKIVEGWISIVQDSSEISGEWNLNKVGDPENIGPQVGRGELVGGFIQDTVWVELNPDVVDNNLQLRGVIDDGKFSGKWEWMTIQGITNYGTFEAVKDIDNSYPFF